jgi:hypothetical protein
VQRLIHCLAILALVTLATTTSRADENQSAANIPGALAADQLRQQQFEPLLAGPSLDAWQVEPWHEGHWTVDQQGVVSYDGQAEHRQTQKNTLWTKQPYGDVQVYVEWRLPAKPEMKPHPIVLFNGDFLLDDDGKRITRPRLDAGDSGILLRGILDCQANIWCQELGSGEINGYRTNKKMPQRVRRAAIPFKKADRPLGQWNVFLITMRGDRMSVELNGERVVDQAELPGAPQTGPIGLQHHGDPVQFRHIWARRLEE